MRKYAAITHSGHIRGHNEDCFSADPDMGLWIVADGVGGHTSGEVASKIACETIRDAVSGGDSLPEAIQQAHRQVLEEIARRDGDEAAQQIGADGQSYNNMGTTVVVLRLQGSDYQLAWAGDSRAYRWNGKLTQLTTDHSFVGELLAKGVLTKEQAAQHPERHVITQSVGVSADMELEAGYLEGELGAHEQLLLCSDGLSDELSEALIALEMQQHGTPQAQADGLLEAALHAGGRDNVTVVVIGAQAAAAEDPDITQELPGHPPAQRPARQVSWLPAGLALAGGLTLLAYLLLT